MDKAEFTRRTEPMADRLFRIAYLTLRSETDCEDAVQEALLRAWRNRGSLREESFFETWLVRILINESRRILAGRLKRRETLLTEMPDSVETPPENLELRDAIRELDAKYRLPLILHHVSGYSTEEVSAILRLPRTTVKWRLTEARRRLGIQLKREEAEIDENTRKSIKRELLL